MHEIDMLVVTCYIFDEYTFFCTFFVLCSHNFDAGFPGFPLTEPMTKSGLIVTEKNKISSA